VKLKDGVSLEGLRREITRILPDVDGTFKRYFYELVITCTTGSHPPEDVHSHGYAIDCRTFGMTGVECDKIVKILQAKLGDEYFVQYEPELRENGKVIRGPHIHIQFAKNLWHAIVSTEKMQRNAALAENLFKEEPHPGMEEKDPDYGL